MKKYLVNKPKHFKLKDYKTDDLSYCEDRETAVRKMEKNAEEIYALQQKLYAEKKEGLIILFQAMDAAGKDGTIRSVLTALQPQGVSEKAFKAPTGTELAHDYLWRVHREVPAKGEIVIFNRSHYEDVLIGKVKKLYKTQERADRIQEEDIIANRYEDIRNFERYLYRNSVRIVKIFLNVSKKEQARRFLSRMEEPEKNWKFNDGDFAERQYWDAYQEAFEDAIRETAVKDAPWYVVPADHKWYMRYVVSEIIRDTLKDMDPHYPKVTRETKERFASYVKEINDEYHFKN